MMCVPSGFSVLSSVVGMTPSLNGSSAGRPPRASWNAASMNSIVGAISTEPVWCSAMTAAGIGGEVRQLGQRQVDLHDAAAGLPVLDVG